MRIGKQLLQALFFLSLTVPTLTAQAAEESEGVLTSKETSLMWVADPAYALNFGFGDLWLTRAQALGFVKAMNSGEIENFGYDDWRLPTRRELNALMSQFDSEALSPDLESLSIMARAALLDSKADQSGRVLAWPVRGQAVLAGFSNVAVLGVNSVHLKQNSLVVSGDVIVNDQSAGPTLACGGREMCLGPGSSTPAGFAVKGDSIQIKSGADALGDLFCNDLLNNGPDPGLACTALDQPGDLPIFAMLPPFESVTGSGSDVTVESGESASLPPGEYGLLKVKQNGSVLFFDDGSSCQYSFREIDSGSSTELRFADPCDVRVEEKFALDQNSFIGSDMAGEVAASEVIFYVAGINGNNGNLGANPDAAKIGIGSDVSANFYVPNGTLWLRQNTVATGAFIALDTIVGIGVVVGLDSFFEDNQPPQASDDEAEVDEGGMVTIDVLANDDDPEMGPLTLNPILVTEPDHGTSVLVSNEFKYTHDGSETTSDSFEYEVCDDQGLCDTAVVNITVNPVNDPPDAMDDGATVDEGDMVTIDVLSNDDDPEDDNLSLGAVPVAGMGPSRGSVAIVGSQIKYTHDGSETLSDSFKYEVCDDGLPVECDTATVSITVNPVNDPPLAAPDAHSAIGNTELIVATSLPITPHITSSPGVLANDDDVDGPGPLQVVPGVIATANGGQVDILANGSFAYKPPAGFEGVDTFSYTVSDGVDTSAGFVVITVAESVWYVDNTHPAAGDGRSHFPFRRLKDVESAPGSGAGDHIFVHRGDGTSALMDEGIVLKDAQRLIGQGPALIVSGFTLVAADGGANPVVSNTSGDGITLAQNNFVTSITVDSPIGAGIFGSSLGTVTISDAIVSNAGGPSANLDNGILDVTFDSLSSNGSSTGGLRVVNSSGSFTVLGATSATSANGDGVVLDNNPAAIFSFSTVTVSNNGGTAFLASKSGTLSVADATGTIDATTGTAVHISDTAIGAGGVAFRSASASGAASGIVLSNTGSVPGAFFEIRGDGPSDPSDPTLGRTTIGLGGAIGLGSGGTITNVTDGVLLTSATDVRLRNMVLGDGTASLNDAVSAASVINDNGIEATNVIGLILDNVILSRTADHGIQGFGANVGLTMIHSEILNAGDNGAGPTDGDDAMDYRTGIGGPAGPHSLTGTVTIARSILAGMSDTGLEVENFSGDLDLNVTDSFIGNNHHSDGNCNPCEGDGLLLRADGGSATIDMLVGDTVISNIANDGIDLGNDDATNTSTLIVEGLIGTGNNNADNLIDTSNTNGNLRVRVTDLSSDSSHRGTVLFFKADGAATTDITVNTSDANPNLIQGSAIGNGIEVLIDGNPGTGILANGNARVLIQNTDISNIFNAGISLLVQDMQSAAGELDVTLDDVSTTQPTRADNVIVGSIEVVAGGGGDGTMQFNMLNSVISVGSTFFGTPLEGLVLRGDRQVDVACSDDGNAGNGTPCTNIGSLTSDDSLIASIMNENGNQVNDAGLRAFAGSDVFTSAALRNGSGEVLIVNPADIILPMLP